MSLVESTCPIEEQGAYQHLVLRFWPIHSDSIGVRNARPTSAGRIPQRLRNSSRWSAAPRSKTRWIAWASVLQQL